MLCVAKPMVEWTTHIFFRNRGGGGGTAPQDLLGKVRKPQQLPSYSIPEYLTRALLRDPINFRGLDRPRSVPEENVRIFGKMNKKLLMIYTWPFSSRCCRVASWNYTRKTLP